MAARFIWIKSRPRQKLLFRGIHLRPSTTGRFAIPFEISAIVFDFYGTLVNTAEVASRCAEVTSDAGAFSARWRAKQIEYTLWLSMMGRYRNFVAVTEAALDFTLKQFGANCDKSQRARLMSAWSEPVAYPEAGKALPELARGHELVILSNGTDEMLARGLAHIGLRDCFSRVLSADLVQVYKPSPRVYELVLKECGVSKEKVLFVSSNSFDVIGATSFGFKVCRVDRHKTALDPLGFASAITVADLNELVREIAA
jgi:2-haloacid dehalogenase